MTQIPGAGAIGLRGSKEVIRGLHNVRAEHRGCVATLGTFDGVHLGHQAIMKQVVTRAKATGLPSVAVIFEPQPHEYFAGEKAPARVMRFREKILALFAEGIERVVCLRFNQALSSLSAQAFVDEILVKGLGVRYLVVGDDFRFGADRQGDYHFLKQAGKAQGFEVTDTYTHLIEGARASSTRIRQALHDGDFTLASQLLGRPYAISGYVQAGKQLGRQLGTPTANVNLRRYCSPLSGVFAVTVKLPSGERYNGVANVGVRPTVDGAGKPLLEVNLFDFAGDLYGQLIQVEFVCKLRSEKRFASVDALKAQIQNDIQQAKQVFGSA